MSEAPTEIQELLVVVEAPQKAVGPVTDKERPAQVLVKAKCVVVFV